MRSLWHWESYLLVVVSSWTCLHHHYCSSVSGSTLLPTQPQEMNTTVGTTECIACNPVGSLTVTPCNNTTAGCVCRTGYEGVDCAQCQVGFYTQQHLNGSMECVPCQCDKTGSLNSSCDRFGTCLCKGGVGGLRCDQCLSSYHSLSANGCQPCSCRETVIKCLYSSKSKDSTISSMCKRCLQNASWVRYCTNTVCHSSEYITQDGKCKPCQCKFTSGVMNGSRRCDLVSGECPECKGIECPTDIPSQGHIPYKLYIIVSGSVASVIVIILAVLVTIYCRRRCRRTTRRTPLPRWTIELRRDNGDENDPTAELACEELDVMYLDDSYLMDSSDRLAETGNISNGRTGYHILS